MKRACSVDTPAVTEGPYWVEEHLFRSDIRTDPATGAARAGTPLTLAITVVNSNDNCSVLTGAYVDIWHCDAKGIYSDESAYNPGGGTGNVTTTGTKFLRGYQVTDSNGQVNFLTIYPGWYTGRTIHIHVRIRTYNGSTALTNYTTQIFFDDAVNNTVLATSAYSRTTPRDTTNATDNVYGSAPNNTTMLATPAPSGAGYTASITIDLAAIAPAAAVPQIAANAILNAAGGAAGMAPGAWVSLYGTNLATTTYQATQGDLASGLLPTNLKNTTVLIDGIAAYLDYISPSQINLLVPPKQQYGQRSGCAHEWQRDVFHHGFPAGYSSRSVYAGDLPRGRGPGFGWRHDQRLRRHGVRIRDGRRRQRRGCAGTLRDRLWPHASSGNRGPCLHRSLSDNKHG